MASLTLSQKLNPGVDSTPGLDSLFITRTDFSYEHLYQERVRRNCAS